MKDRVAAQLFNWGIRWRTPCSDLSEALTSPDWEEQCYRFTKPERMHGFWRNNYEASQFCDRRAACGSGHRSDFTWLQFRKLPAGWEDTPPGGLYAIDFIGRRSEHGGLFGGQAMANQEVAVERLISISLAEPPPPGQMTQEHVQAYLRECDGALLCMPNSEVRKK